MFFDGCVDISLMIASIQGRLNRSGIEASLMTTYTVNLTQKIVT